MDPNTLLQAIRERAAAIDLAPLAQIDPMDAQELAEFIRNLDTWITTGGFLPADWKA